MLNTYMPWVLFALSAAAILVAGRSLSADADKIAELYGLGKGFVGVILLGAVTSLPELITTTSAASPLVSSGDIAVGNVFGSNLFNLTILAIIDPFSVRKRVTNGNIVTGLVAVMLTLVAMLGLVQKAVFTIGPFSWVSLVLVATYVFGMWLIYVVEKATVKEQQAGSEGVPQTKRESGKGPIIRFLVAGVFVIGAGFVASFSVDAIAEQTQIGKSFAGALLLAFATSLPELVVSITAIRLGSAEMAVGNLLGSNCFNIVILAAADGVDGADSLFANLSSGHMTIALISIATICLATMGGVAGIKRRLPLLRLGWDTSAISVLYIVGMVYLFCAPA